MAIVEKPEFDKEEVMALDDSDNEADDVQYSGFVDIIRDKFRHSKDRRLTDEERWLTAYKNYRGIYDDTTQFTDTERSQIFIKVTKTKVLAAYSQVTDVLFAGNKFPIGVEETKIPVGIKDTVHIDAAVPEQLQDIYDELNVGYAGDGQDIPKGAVRSADIKPFKDKLDPVKEEVKDGPGSTPTAAVYEPAVGMRMGITILSLGQCLAWKQYQSGISIQMQMRTTCTRRSISSTVIVCLVLT